MIVEDDALRRDLQRRLSRSERLDVVETVSAGAEQLEYRASPPDLFLLDRGALAALRERARRDRLPCSPLTAQEQDVLRSDVPGRGV